MSYFLKYSLQALETELVSREPLVNSIVERGRRMDNSNSEAKVAHLEQRFQELTDSISLRRLRLSDALEAQTVLYEYTFKLRYILITTKL